MKRGCRVVRALFSSSFVVLIACLVCLRGTAGDLVYNGKHIAKGVEYIHKQVSDVPWSVHVVRIDRTVAGLALITTMPTNHAVGLTRTTEQLQFIPSEQGKPLAAINGDFFSWPKGAYQGDPAGLQICDGEMVSAAPRAKEKMIHGSPEHAVALWVDGKRDLHIERVSSKMEAIFPNGVHLPIGLNQNCTNDTAVLFTRAAGTSTRITNQTELVLGQMGSDWLPLRAGRTYTASVRAISRGNSAISDDVVVLSIGKKLLSKLPKLQLDMVVKIATTTAPDLRGIGEAISGGPILVKNGKTFAYADTKRNPRTAVGFNDRYIYFVVVDGRRVGVSDGMSFEELSKEMAWWGCKEAMNLDGGGSATIWANGQIMNQPSDNKERAVANDLVVVKRIN